MTDIDDRNIPIYRRMISEAKYWGGMMSGYTTRKLGIWERLVKGASVELTVTFKYGLNGTYYLQGDPNSVMREMEEVISEMQVAGLILVD